MKMMGMKCSHCGSTNVGADLASEWDKAAQGWDACGDLDGRQCHDCGDEDCIEEYQLRGQELADAMHKRRMCGIDALIHRIAEVTTEGGSIGLLALSEVSTMAYSIRARLAQYAAAMAEQDKLVDALALTLPYAESRRDDLLDAKLNGEEDKSCPGADEATSVIDFAEQVLAQHGRKSYLLARGQRAGGAE